MIPFYFNRHLAAVASAGGDPERRVLIASCAADLYRPPDRAPDEPEEAPTNRNGFALAGKLWIGRREDVVTVEGDTRPVVVAAQSQFWYHGVRLLGRYVGHDAPLGSGDVLPVYAATVCFHCLSAADYFEREEVGEDWIQESGAAAIEDGQLVTSDSDARFWYWQARPSRPIFALNFTSEVMSVLVTLSSEAVGSEASILQGDLTGAITSVSWRFEDGQGRLVVRNYDVEGNESVPSSAGPVALPPYEDDVGSTFLFPGLGAGTPVTIRFCRLSLPSNRFNVEVLQPDGRWWPARSAFGHLGIFGLGSREVTGQVHFDNFEVNFGPAAPALAHCDTCQNCHACPDDQQLCLVYRDEGGSAHQAVLTRGDWASGCNWGNVSFACDLIHQRNGLWIIRVCEPNVSVINTGRWFVALLGEPVPRCDDWHCVPLFEIEEAAGGLWPDTQWDEETLAEQGTPSGWSISSGSECLYYCGSSGGFDQCCEGGNSMPGTLYMSATLNGSSIVEDMELTNQGEAGNPGGFFFSSNPFIPLPSGYAGCISSVPNSNPDKVTASVQTASNPGGVTINLTVESCDPFYATGTREFPEGSGDVYVIEVYA